MSDAGSALGDGGMTTESAGADIADELRTPHGGERPVVERRPRRARRHRPIVSATSVGRLHAHGLPKLDTRDRAIVLPRVLREVLLTSP